MDTHSGSRFEKGIPVAAVEDIPDNRIVVNILVVTMRRNQIGGAERRNRIVEAGPRNQFEVEGRRSRTEVVALRN